MLVKFTDIKTKVLYSNGGLKVVFLVLLSRNLVDGYRTVVSSVLRLLLMLVAKTNAIV